ncbi:MAG: CSLREA domain-containing protein [Deltaproteobacteria bacterium]|nr:CSLREA domain-containing protein [Deltaproteobacteria bacterium]
MRHARSVSFAILLGLASAGTSAAASFQVDSTADSPAVKPGSGKCESKAGGCTLRAAIEEANATELASTIQIPAGTYKLAVPGAGPNFAQSGILLLDGEITISGEDSQSTIIDGAGLNRVFEIALGSTISISDVTIQGGLAKGADGGGMLNRGSVTLTDVLFNENRARTDPGQANGRGAGLFNQGQAKLQNVSFTRNSADGRGGGIYNGTGATVEMMNGQLFANGSKTDSGGGVANEGTMKAGIVLFRKNMANDGGGIDNIEGKLDLFDVSMVQNGAGANAGAIRNSGDLSIVNTTIGMNQAGVSAGAIENRAKGKLKMNNVTIARNEAGSEGKGEGGGILSGKDGQITVANSVIAGNAVRTVASDCSGTLQSQGYNLLQSEAGCTLAGEKSGNLLGQSPQLGKIGPNGGPTPSFLPNPSSPIIDAANPAKPTGADGTCAGADQRGVARPQMGKQGAEPRCDMGSIERKKDDRTTNAKPYFPSKGEPTSSRAQADREPA